MIQSCIQSDFSTKDEKENPVESIQLVLFPGIQVKTPYS